MEWSIITYGGGGLRLKQPPTPSRQGKTKFIKQNNFNSKKISILPFYSCWIVQCTLLILLFIYAKIEQNNFEKA